MDNIDFEAVVDSTLRFQENLQVLKEEYPQYLWEVQKKKPSSQKERPVWRREFDPRSHSLVYTATVLVKPYKVRAKKSTYIHGRIQATVDKEWIGREAKISICIPHLPPAPTSGSNNSNKYR